MRHLHIGHRFILSELVELGRTDVALDVLAKRGDWDRLWEVATKEKMAASTVGKFVIMRIEEVCPRNSSSYSNDLAKTMQFHIILSIK